MNDPQWWFLPIFGHISLESQYMTMKLWGNHQSIAVSWYRVNLKHSSKSHGHHCWIIEWSLMPKIPMWNNSVICRDMTMKLWGYYRIIDLCWFLKFFDYNYVSKEFFRSWDLCLLARCSLQILIDNFDRNFIIFVSNRGSIQ